jgi:hypothetical protein
MASMRFLFEECEAGLILGPVVRKMLEAGEKLFQIREQTRELRLLAF